jgi:uncharacterized protein YndB with AHSA1/START domain
MAVANVANSATFTVSTPSDREIRITRLFDAPRRLVFEAMSKPEHIKRWWGRLGDGYSVPVCEVDFRPGGAWRFVNRHPKGEAAFHGVYREITPPQRMVFTVARSARHGPQDRHGQGRGSQLRPARRGRTRVSGREPPARRVICPIRQASASSSFATARYLRNAPSRRTLIRCNLCPPPTV